MATDKEEIKDIWKAIAAITKGMEELSNDINKLVAFNTLKDQIGQMIEDKLKELGFRETKEFTNHSKFVT